MNMENRKSFSSDPRKPNMRLTSTKDWEEGTKNEKDAALIFGQMNIELKALGIEITTDKKILEVGTGLGFMTKYLVDHGYNAVGIDGRPTHEGSLPIARARIEELPFSDNSFDVIFSSGIWDEKVYSQDTRLMQSEIARVLKSDGVYVSISTPAYNQENESFVLLNDAKDFMAIFKKK